MAYREAEISDVILEAKRANRGGDRLAIVKMLDMFSDGQFSAASEYRSGAMDALLENLANATDREHISEIVKQITSIARLQRLGSSEKFPFNK